MPVCPKCHRGFIFHPEYGRARCSNVKCDWNLYRKNTGIWSAEQYDEDLVFAEVTK